jgi:hypothetical protein
VARGGKTVVPTYSIKITTSIMVKFSPVTDLWVARLLDHSVLSHRPQNSLTANNHHTMATVII